MKVALDTNAYVEFCRGNQDVVTAIAQSEFIFLPFIVLGELRAGFASGTKSRGNEQVLRRFIQSRRVEVLWPDEETCRYYANIFSHLRSLGSPIPTNDLWISSLVAQKNVELITFDKHFLKVPDVLIYRFKE